MEELQSVCEKLQQHKQTLCDVRALFDACMAKYPVMEEYLKPTTNIVHSPTLKLLLSRSRALVRFPVPRPRRLSRFDSEESEDELAADFASEIFRRAKKSRTSQRRAVDYVPLLGVISPTSNRCERKLSECKYVLESHRASMRSATFERLLFLKANRDLWNASTLVP